MPNEYANEVFGSGRQGIIQLRAGGELEVSPMDVFVFNEAGDLLIRHTRDKFRSVTYIPKSNIGYIRTRDQYERKSVQPYRREIEDGHSDEELRELIAGDDGCPNDEP